MTHPTRREFLGAASAATAMATTAGSVARAAAILAPKATDVAVEDVSFEYEDHRYRTPL